MKTSRLKCEKETAFSINYALSSYAEHRIKMFVFSVQNSSCDRENIIFNYDEIKHLSKNIKLSLNSGSHLKTVVIYLEIVPNSKFCDRCSHTLPHLKISEIRTYKCEYTAWFQTMLASSRVNYR